MNDVINSVDNGSLDVGNESFNIDCKNFNVEVEISSVDNEIPYVDGEIGCVNDKTKDVETVACSSDCVSQTITHFFS